MSKRAQRLSLVLELAERTEQQAAQTYEMARRLWQEDAQKLQDLELYCVEYEASISTARVVRRAQDMVRDRGFLQQIYRARQQQESVVKQREGLTEQKKQLWHKAHLKHSALRNLIERMREDEQKALNRKEEKLLDEWFAQAAQHRDGRGMGSI